MEILSVRLQAINPNSRPQTLHIAARPNEHVTIGRSNFSTGEDTIISRRHALFNITVESGLERLSVRNLSAINGMLVNFTPVHQFVWRTLFDGDEIVFRTPLCKSCADFQCFSGAHGITERVPEDQIAAEAERYRYRVVIQRGTRNRNELNSKKREREVIIEERQNKRPREDIIELSSDGDEPPRRVIGESIIPVTVDSTTDEDSDIEEDLENTLVDDVDLFTGEKSTSSESGQSREVSASSLGTSSSSADKGKGKEVMLEQFLDIQEELECFICCFFPFENSFIDGSDVVTSSSYLFSLWSCRLRSLQYFPFKKMGTKFSLQMERKI
jgi:FHA domain